MTAIVGVCFSLSGQNTTQTAKKGWISVWRLGGDMASWREGLGRYRE